MDHQAFRMKSIVVGLLSASGLLQMVCWGQDRTPAPYFVTYDHYLEEVDSLEIESNAILGHGHNLNTFLGGWVNFEYGVRKWWTTEVYIDGQHTRHEGSFFTGFRFENRFRPLLESHRVNPILYFEYEHLNGADKTLKEVVGFDGKEDLNVPGSEARQEVEREIETKLILSSEIGEWNLSENIIGAKNVNGGRWEFGYAIGLSRPLAAYGRRCTFCAQRFAAGLELYGGLGTWGDLTLRGTSQYIAPVLIWNLPSETVIRISPGWGLTDESAGILFRVGVSHEFDNIAHTIGKVFHRH
jgi:hypothetical protein